MSIVGKHRSPYALLSISGLLAALLSHRNRGGGLDRADRTDP